MTPPNRGTSPTPSLTQSIDHIAFFPSPERAAPIGDRDNYDIDDLRNLLRRDQNLDLEAMIERVRAGFLFLDQLTDVERALTADMPRRARAKAAELIATVIAEM